MYETACWKASDHFIIRNAESTSGFEIIAPAMSPWGHICQTICSSRLFFCWDHPGRAGAFLPFLFYLYSLSDKVTAPGGSFTWSFPPIAAGSVSFEIWVQLFSQIPDSCGNNYIRRKHTPRQIDIKNVTSDCIYRRYKSQQQRLPLILST